MSNNLLVMYLLANQQQPQPQPQQTQPQMVCLSHAPEEVWVPAYRGEELIRLNTMRKGNWPAGQADIEYRKWLEHDLKDRKDRFQKAEAAYLSLKGDVNKLESAIAALPPLPPELKEEEKLADAYAEVQAWFTTNPDENMRKLAESNLAGCLVTVSELEAEGNEVALQEAQDFLATHGSNAEDPKVIAIHRRKPAK